MNGWGLGTIRSTGLVWGATGLLSSELGCERVHARRWHEPLMSLLGKSSPANAAASQHWFSTQVLPWVKAQAVRAAPGAHGVLWLSYLQDLAAEAEAYGRFVLGGGQVFRIARHLQRREDFLDMGRTLQLPTALPYPAFFLVMESHPAFAVWDDVRAPESVDGCFISQLPGGVLDLTFTLRSEQGASGLPGVSVRLPGDAGVTAATVHQAVSRALESSQPSTPNCRQGGQSPLEAIIQRQTAARVHALAFAVNRVLKLLDVIASVQRQDADISSYRLRADAARFRRNQVLAAPVAPRTVQLQLQPVCAVGLGIAHYRVAGTVAVHWRRAHWRLQPCGPGREQRKLVRIASAQVGNSVATAERAGYNVRA